MTAVRPAVDDYVDLTLSEDDTVVEGSSGLERTGTDITTLEITPTVAWLRVLGRTGPGAQISTLEFRDQLHRLKAFLLAGRK